MTQRNTNEFEPRRERRSLKEFVAVSRRRVMDALPEVAAKTYILGGVAFAVAVWGGMGYGCYRVIKHDLDANKNMPIIRRVEVATAGEDRIASQMEHRIFLDECELGKVILNEGEMVKLTPTKDGARVYLSRGFKENRYAGQVSNAKLEQYIQKHTQGWKYSSTQEAEK